MVRHQPVGGRGILGKQIPETGGIHFGRGRGKQLRIGDDRDRWNAGFGDFEPVHGQGRYG